MKTILITGATGFIGRRVVTLLAKAYKKENIIVLLRKKNDDLERSGRAIVKKLKLHSKYVDLVTGNGLQTIPKNPDIIIHLAANTNTSDPNQSVNDIGTKNLIDSLGKLSKNSHFIHISTTALMSGRRDCSKPFDENSKPHPTNEYGRTKLKAEKIVLQKCKNDKFRLTIFRLPTVYGKNMREDSFFNFLKKYIDKDSFVSRLNWPGISSFVHVDDVANTIIKIIKHPPKPGHRQLFILQAESYTLQQIFELAYSYYNKRYSRINIPEPFWGIAKHFRKHVYLMERFLPAHIYNYFWRVSIIVDNVIYSKSNKIKVIIPSWKPKKLTNHIDEVL